MLHRFSVAILFALYCSLSGTVSVAADLEACKSAKHRQLKLEKSGRQATPASSQSRGNRRRQVAELDEWLWKHCRSHSRALRELERQRL